MGAEEFTKRMLLVVRASALDAETKEIREGVGLV